MVRGTVALHRRPRYGQSVRRYAPAGGARVLRPVVQRAAVTAVRYAASRVGRYARKWISGTAKKRKRVSTPQFLSGGGRYAGNFKRMRKYKKKGPFRGISATIENVGELTAGAADQTIMVGTHAYAAQIIGTKLFLAILRALSFKMGSPFRNEHDYVDGLNSVGSGNVGNFTVAYSINGQPDLLEFTATAVSTSSFRELATALWTSYNAAANNTQTNMRFHYICFSPQVRSATVEYTGGITKLDLRNSLVTYMFIDTLKIQNRTGANTPTELDADNIEANPIRVTRFVVKGNALRLNWCNDGTVSPSFLCTSTTGSVAIDTQDASLTAGMKDLFTHAPAGSAFSGLKSRTTNVLQPGSIKRSAVPLKGTMYIDTMFKLVLHGEASAVGNDSLFGCSQWHHIEKSLRTGTGTATAKIGYEHIMGITLTIKPSKKMPFIRANS